MSKKNKRREAAQKKARQRKIAMLYLCGLAILAVVAVAVVMHITRPQVRVFAAEGNLSVTLYENGNFSARLAKNVNLSGTFTEVVSGNMSTITFNHGGNTVFTHIEDDVLILPVPWRAVCVVHSHAIEFPRRR